MNSRACVYLDLKDRESGNSRTLLRICGPTTTLGSLQQDAETCAKFGEVLEGFRIFFEDPIADPKKVQHIVAER